MADNELALLFDNPDLSTLLSVYPKQAIDKLRRHKGNLTEISNALNSIQSGMSQNSIIMTCDTRRCPYKSSCVLNLSDIAPDGYKCPLERKLVSELEYDILKELDIDSGDPIEMELLWDLIDTKILDMRASAAMGDGLVMQEVIIENKMARSSKLEISPALLAKIEIKKLKHSIMEDFLATRKSKKRYGVGDDVGNIEDVFRKAVEAAIEQDK